MTESIALFNHCPGLQSGVDEELINLGFSPISFSELAALFLEQIYTLSIVRVRYGAGYGWLAMTRNVTGLFGIDVTLHTHELSRIEVAQRRLHMFPVVKQLMYSDAPRRSFCSSA